MDALTVGQSPAGARTDAGRAAADDLTVVVADHDPLSRAAVCAALESDGIRVVAAVEDATTAVIAARDHRPRLCLIAPDLPGDGVKAIAAIRRRWPTARIAALTRLAADDISLRAIQAGADGCLETATAPETMCDAARALAGGETVLPPQLTRRLLRELDDGGLHGGAARGADERRRVGAIGRARNAILYGPRFIRHYRHRRRSSMHVGRAWASTRERMLDYRYR
jgi:DNA-binding NarL/FixJ family response regulator